MSRSLRALCVLLPFVSVLSCGGGGGDYTKGNFCSSIGNSICNRVVECGITTSISACASQIQDLCCRNAGTCNDTPDSAEFEDAARDTAASCAVAVDNFDCDLLYDYYVPTACDYAALGAVLPANLSTPVRQSKAPGNLTAAVRKLDARALGLGAGQRLGQKPGTVDLSK